MAGSETGRELMKRFVAGHVAVEELERGRRRREGVNRERALADALALFDALASLGPLREELVCARRDDEAGVRATWAKLRARYPR